MWIIHNLEWYRGWKHDSVEEIRNYQIASNIFKPQQNRGRIGPYSSYWSERNIPDYGMNEIKLNLDEERRMIWSRKIKLATG